MELDKNDTDYEVSLPEQHEVIANHLKLEDRFKKFINNKKQDYYSNGKKKQRFPDNDKKALIKHFNLICESCGTSLGSLELDKKIKSKDVASRLTKRLNYFLKDYSRDIGVDPAHPIKVFSYHKGPDKIDETYWHFACAKSEIHMKNRSYSWDNITLKEAKERGIKKSEDKQVSNFKQETENVISSSPFKKLEDRLKPFYKRYPTKKDLEDGGSYYRIDKLHEEITNKLREKKRCLILGNPGCGKTTLALALGYDFLQDNYSVYYHDASTSSNIKQLADFVKSCGKNDLVILDNAHAGFNSINNMLCENYRHEYLLLVTSRNIDSTITKSPHPDDLQEGISYVEIFKEEKAFKELCANKNTIRHIINQYAGSIVPEEKIGNIENLVDKCKADYNILRFYVQAWKSKGCAGCLSGVNETEILEDVFTRYFKDKSYQLELLKIAALSQFEIDVDSKWVKGDLDELQKDGLVQLVGTDELNSGKYISWIRIYHPSAANYFLKAAAFKHLYITNSVDYFSLRCIYSYLETRPQNLLRVVGNTPFDEERRIYHNIYLDNTLFDVICKVIEGFDFNFIVTNHCDIANYILGVIGVSAENDYSRAEKVFNIFLSRVKGMCPNVLYLKVFISLLIISRNFTSLWSSFSSLDFREIGKKTRKGPMDFVDISIFVKELKDANTQREKIAEFCSELDFRCIGKEIMNNDDSWKRVTWFLHLDIAGNLSRENILLCLNELDYKKLSKHATKSASKACDYIFSFLLCSRGVGISENKIVTFFEGLDFEELGLKAREGDEDVFVLLNFIRLALSAKVTGSSIRSFCGNLAFRKLGTQARKRKVEFKDVELFFGLLQGVGVPNDSLCSFVEGFHHPA
jgi:GTPase SAR1 family protein